MAWPRDYEHSRSGARTRTRRLARGSNPLRSTARADGPACALGAVVLPESPRGVGAGEKLTPLRRLRFDPPEEGGGVRALGPIRLTPADGRRVLASAASGKPLARLQLGANAGGRQFFELTLSRVDVGVPDACQGLPVSDVLATPVFELNTTLRLRDGGTTETVMLPAVWRCVRDRALNVSELETIAPRALTQRPGLAVSVSGPRIVVPGASVTYLVRVRNHRRARSGRLVPSLWHVVVLGTVTPRGGIVPAKRVNWRLAELRCGASKTMRFTVHIPSSVGRGVCVAALASADSARPASAQTCPRIAHTPRVGLG